MSYTEIAKFFLKEYATALGNNGCNDFDLEKLIPNIEQRRLFVKEYHEWNGDPYDFDPNYLELPDFAVVAFVGSKL